MDGICLLHLSGVRFMLLYGKTLDLNCMILQHVIHEMHRLYKSDLRLKYI